MTWTRIYQAGADHRVVTDIDFQSSNVVAVTTAQAHTGTYSYEVGVQDCLWGFAVAASAARNRVGYWVRHGGFANSNAFLYVASRGKTQYESPYIGIRVNAALSQLEVVRPESGTSNNYSTLATQAMNAALLAELTWMHIGVYHYAHETDGVINLYVNGTLLLNYTGDTRLYGQGNGFPEFSTGPIYLWWMGGWQGTGSLLDAVAYVDDIFADNSSDEAAAPVPARTFDIMLPSGAGTNAGWTPLSGTNVSNIDDNPNDGDTTYNKALSTALKDSFAFSNVTVPTDHTIVAMIPTVFAKRLDTETDVKLRLIAYDGATYKNGADQVPAMDYAVPLWERMTTQPDSSAWNETDANAAEFGYESRGSYA